MTKIYKLDAEGRPIGRVASRAASILRGKNNPDFKPNVVPNVKVEVTNVTKVAFTGNKQEQKTFVRYSGYPSGLKTIKFDTLFSKDPQKAFRKVVEGMLPKNKLKKKLLKNLIFS
jgi:large subunit ribosomal protein L13